MKDSKIEWCDHTFNPWWGCTKVSPACDNCYAEALAKRWGYNIWGRGADRRFFGDKHWQQPLKWNEQAEKEGVRRRVFCASMADVFDPRKNNYAGSCVDLPRERRRLWHLVVDTPNLDWLILTKRPYKIASYIPWNVAHPIPNNIWFGATTENQKWFDNRMKYLCCTPSIKRFISVEPMLGAIDISAYAKHIDWIICGGESGHGARPTKIEWVRDLRDQCQAHGIAFFFKQWGNCGPDGIYRKSKQANGRLLDGVAYNEFP